VKNRQQHYCQKKKEKAVVVAVLEGCDHTAAAAAPFFFFSFLPAYRNCLSIEAISPCKFSQGCQKWIYHLNGWTQQINK
jgi:hypothetical protein